MRYVATLAGFLAVAAPVSAQVPEFSAPTWTTGYEYTAITSVRVLSDGRVLLLDVGENRLQALTATGKPLREIGRAGAGPGEFRGPRSLVALRGDSTALVDVVLRRIQYLDGRLQFGATVPFPKIDGDGPGDLTLADARGHLFFKTFAYRATEPQAALVRWDPRRNRVDTLGKMLQPLLTRPIKVGLNLAQYVIPYRPEDGWGMTPDGQAVMVRASPYVVESVTSGRAPFRKALSAPAVVVTAGDRKGWPTVVQDSIPRTKPPFDPSGIVSGSDGSVWIPRHYPRDAKLRQWDVVNPGTSRHVVRTLRSTQEVRAVTAAGVYIVTTGPDDLQRLEFHRHGGK
jgi:hypothetical protein